MNVSPIQHDKSDEYKPDREIIDSWRELSILEFIFYSAALLFYRTLKLFYVVFYFYFLPFIIFSLVEVKNQILSES